MQIGMFVIEYHHEGYMDEIVHLPICDGCGKPITNFEEANLISDMGPLGDETKLGEVVGRLNGAPLRVQPCELKAFHFACDKTEDSHFTGWTRIGRVFRNEQQESWAK